MPLVRIQTKNLQICHRQGKNFTLFVELKHIKQYIWVILLLVMTGGGSVSCKKERWFTGNTKLAISTDTLWFDTVFTRQPGSTYPISVTKIIYVKNTENQPIKFSIRLAGGKSSPFRFNIDGFVGPEVNDVELLAKDSAFIFVQCTLEPNNSNKPALVLDSLITVVNGTEQRTRLAAYGWDAHYIRSAVLPCGGSWADKTKPYVIVNNALVETGCTFTIKEGVKVYNSARSLLIVQGTLKLEGTSAEPIDFVGDKPAFSAKFLPNQWGGIYLLRGSINNKFEYARIYNASIGVRVDSLPEAGTYNLVMNQCEVKHCGQACVAGVTAAIQAVNCLFADAGSYSFIGLMGGNYDLKHCTFANYFSGAVRNTATLTITNCIRDEFGAVVRDEDLTCNLYNSIVYGALETEYFGDNSPGALFQVDLRNVLMKAKNPVSGSAIQYNLDPKFKNRQNYQFDLDTLSPAKDAGLGLSPPVLIDLLNKPRNGSPDLGCYERQD